VKRHARKLNPADRAILEFLGPEPRPVRDLLGTLPKGTLYRRLATLRARGLVVKHGTQYALTSVGQEAKTQGEAAALSDGFAEVYPPLTLLPSPQHRALAELVLAALVVRQLTDQEERHAGFVLIGPTLTGKTSAGRFLCHAAGVDPATHVIDLAGEAGKSLWIRRGAGGDVVAQRAIVEAPLVVFDEYQLADPAVRRALAPFLSGRRRIPFENTVLPIAPVPLLTLNPGPGTSLSARTGLPIAQLRRVLVCNLGALDLPNLALEGDRAVETARQAGPLALQPPRGSCEQFRNPLVRLLRQTLRQEALGSVDVDLLLGLGRGMTAWLPELAAMRQALFDALLVLETLGWVQPRWLELVRAFPGSGGDDVRPPAPAPKTASREILEAGAEPSIRLFPDRPIPTPSTEDPRMSARGESMMPTFTLSGATKARLIWLAEELGTSVDQAVQMLINGFTLDESLKDLEEILRLRQECRTGQVSVRDLRRFLELASALKEQDLDVDDLGTALRVAEGLAEAGLTFDQAREVQDLMEALRAAGVDPTVLDELRYTLERCRALGVVPEQIQPLADLATRLGALGLSPEQLEDTVRHLEAIRALGLDAEAAERLAAALDAAGVRGSHRETALGRVAETVCALGGVAELESQKAGLEETIARLETTLESRREALRAIQNAIREASDEQRKLSADLRALEEEGALRAEAIASAVALQLFLLGRTGLSDPFWSMLARLRAIKNKYPGRLPWVEQELTEGLRRRVLEFLIQIASMRASVSPSKAGEAQGSQSS